MKRILIFILLICAVCPLVVSCGPSDGFTGTFVKETDGATYTVTLSSGGTFKYVRKLKADNPEKGGPFDTSAYNLRQGTYKLDTFDKNKIVITYTHDDPATGMRTVTATANLYKSGSKIYLNIVGSGEIDGMFAKK